MFIAVQGISEPSRRDQHFLCPVSANVPQNRVRPPAALAALADIRGPVARAIANKWNNGVEKTGADDFATLPRRCDRRPILIQELEEAVRWPDVAVG